VGLGGGGGGKGEGDDKRGKRGTVNLGQVNF